MIILFNIYLYIYITAKYSSDTFKKIFLQIKGNKHIRNKKSLWEEVLLWCGTILFICCSLKCSVQLSCASFFFFPTSSSTPELPALFQPVVESGHKRCDWKQKPASIDEQQLARVFRERETTQIAQKATNNCHNLLIKNNKSFLFFLSHFEHNARPTSLQTKLLSNLTAKEAHNCLSAACHWQ